MISSELQARDLPSKRLLGKGLASVGYETEWNGERFARLDFIGVPRGIFQKEAAVLVGLKDHDNVVKAHGRSMGKMSCSLVLEFMAGDLLDVLLKRKESQRTLSRPQPFELREALDIMLQISRGMEYLHEQNILHGDLKTKNILVAYLNDEDRNLLSVKVADFGLVRTKRKSMSFVSRQARKLDVVQWRAPECIEILLSEDTDETTSESDGECADSPARVTPLSADVYSFAVTCNHILTGEDPYPNLNWKVMGAEIVSGALRPKLPAPCPSLLVDLLVSCWDKPPAQRPTFSNIRAALEHLCNSQTDLLQDHMLHVDNLGVLKELWGGGGLVALSLQEDEAGRAASVHTEEHQSLATLEQRMAGVQVRQEFDHIDTPGSNLQSRYQDNHGENEEHKVQGSSSMEHRGGDDKSRGKRPRSRRESLEKEEDRRVLQRVSPFDTSAMGMGETRKTTQATEVQGHKQPVLENLFKYDVFLNHRGPDLRKTFVSHLAAALRQAGRDPFLDAKSLMRGQHALSSINEALTGVHVHIAIFSPRYAESKYCLNELCDMLESRKPIIPVFYNVEPENLRWIEDGPFAKAFRKHLRRGRDVDVVRWKAALFQAAAISGFRLVDCDNDTVKLEKGIVAAVLNALPPPSPLPVARHPVWLNDPLAEVIDPLTLQSPLLQNLMSSEENSSDIKVENSPNMKEESPDHIKLGNRILQLPESKELQVGLGLRSPPSSSYAREEGIKAGPEETRLKSIAEIAPEKRRGLLRLTSNMHLLGTPKRLHTFPLRAHIGVNSRMRTECFYRALFSDELELDDHLRELPLPFAAEFRALSTQGRAALEEGDWKTAELRFLRCKEVLKVAELDKRRGTLMEYQPLVAWVNHFLAQSYQAMGSHVNNLQKVMDLRKEIVTYVSSMTRWKDSVFSEFWQQLAKVCFTFYITAQYELGEALGDSSNEKKEAIQNCSDLWGCSDDAAEARICFFLCCDHDCLGRFDESLRWIRKANRVRMQASSTSNRWKFYTLDYEARLLMRLQMFSEAADVLKELCTSGPTRADALTGPTRAVHKLLHECYTEISRRAADIQQAKAYEELATEQRKLMQDLPPVSLHNHPSWEPLWGPMTFHLGSSGLGLARAPSWRGIDLYFSKLPELYEMAFVSFFSKQEDALKQCDWETATIWSEQMREILKMIKKLLPEATYDWLLSWVDLPLAGLYHYHARSYDKALRIWMEIQECEARRNSVPADADTLELSTSKGYQISFAALEYEMSISLPSPQEKDQIIEKWTRAYCTDEESAERELCFWLYFGYHRHGNYEHALKWLRMERRLRLNEESSCVCSRKRGRNIDYFCCDYDYKRCEIGLLTQLGRHEDAVAGLECLLGTEQCVQEDGFTNDDIDDDQLFDEGVQGQLPTANPTATGCILRVEHTAGFHAVPVDRLIQSPVGLEHHLLKLPLPIQLAFRKHGYLGRLYDLELVDWENATFQFECCLEILDTIQIERNPDFKKAYDWLMVWVMLPLANLYVLMKNLYRLAFDLRLKMLSLIEASVGSADQESLQGVRNSLTEDACCAIYMYAISYHPSDSVLKGRVILVLSRMLNQADGLTVELNTMRATRRKFMDAYENIEGALDLVRREKQLLDQKYQEPREKLSEEYKSCVRAEITCLWYLQRRDELNEAVVKYFKSSRVDRVPFPQDMRFMLVVAGNDPDFGEDLVKVAQELLENTKDWFELMSEGAFGRTSNRELKEWRESSRECEKKKEYAEAISYLEKCVELIRKNPSLEGLENSNDERLGFQDKLNIARLHTYSFAHADVSKQQPIEGFWRDEDFRLGVKYYKQCLRLVAEGVTLPLFRSHMVAQINIRLCVFYFYAFLGQYKLYPKSRCDKVLPVTGSCDKDGFLSQGISGDVQARREHDLSEVKTYLEVLRKLPVQRIGERVIALYTRSLHTLGRKQYTEGWIEWLEDHKILYTVLQNYYTSKARLLTDYIRMKSPADVTSEAFYTQREVDASWWNAFLFAEGERTRVMMYQYEMHRRKSLKPHEVRKWCFDVHDRGALRYIKESCRALLEKESTVFVQYSSTIDVSFIYVLKIDQDGCKLFVGNSKSLDEDEGIKNFTTPKRPTPMKRLDDLYKYLAYKQEHSNHTEISQEKKYIKYMEYRKLRRNSSITDDESMNKYLEFLYGALIAPIENHLDKVKPGDKLVLAPSELLTRVPFAALRKPGKDQRRLIERFAFTIVPSLRVLQMCSDRLQDLQNDSRRPYSGRCGSIIALGNPTYNQCGKCLYREPLQATGKEVQKLVELFGDTAVMTLTERDATAKNLLEWAAKPSQESFRQAIVHIGAHGDLDEDDHRNSKLQLACDPPESASNVRASASSGDQAKEKLDMPSARGTADDEHLEDDCADGDESDSQVEDLVNDDGTLNLAEAIFHRVRSGAKSGFMHTNRLAPSEASAIASSSSSSAKIRRFASGSSASSHDLTVEVINNLETLWTAELVVLSAGQTSAGRLTAEGVLSLGRAFMAAGVPCVVASLWKVDKEETVPLMKNFYDELWKGNDVASALQSATLQCMHKHGPDAVQYWAPFNVWGVPSLRIPKELQRKETSVATSRRR